MNVRLLFAACVSIVVALPACSSGGPAGAGVGHSCLRNGDCASGMCIDTSSSSSYCSAPCTRLEDCDSTAAGNFICDPDTSSCVRACGSGMTRGSGASTQICDGSTGLFVACSTREAATSCMACGCEPFGGGVCIAGTGCMHPQPDGTACTLDALCSSGVCYRDSMTCGAPRAMGAPCTIDLECMSQNCSTDGDTSMVGHCNQVLGSSCTAPMNGHQVTPTCTDCDILFGDSSAPCMRQHCDPETANHCPSFGGRVYECAMSVDGTYHCYETCDDVTYSCFNTSDYCHGGYCSG